MVFIAVKIITDSTSDLDLETINSLGIEVLSLFVTFGDQSVKDADVSNELFYEKMAEHGTPSSSQPAVGEILTAMKNVVKAGDDLVCVFLSSNFSGTYQSVILTKNILLDDYPDAKIAVIDSQSTSMQLGLAVLEGARLAKENGDFESVVKKIKETIVRSRFIFSPANLDYLHKGGRIGGAGTLFGNMFKITPILTVKDKEVEVLQTVRTKKRAQAMLIKKIVEDHENYNVEEIIVHHINAYEEALLFQKDLKEAINLDSRIMDIGPIIGLHVGPGSLGLAYRTEKEIIHNK